METLNNIFETIADYAVAFGLKIIGAIIVLIIGLWIIKKITKILSKLMDNRGLDASLRPFITSILNITLKILLVISIMGMLGIEMTSFIAILGAVGLAIGMALSGTLQNFAGGVMILIFKPFKVGDLIESQGHTGTVKEIQIFNTILETLDGQTIILPNAPVSTNVIVNKTTKPIRRVDITVGVSYDADIDQTREILKSLAESDKRVLKDPMYDILVSELADSSVNFAFRLWVNSADYWSVFFDMNEAVKKALDNNGISIPYPQMDVHVHNTNA